MWTSKLPILVKRSLQKIILLTETILEERTQRSPKNKTKKETRNLNEITNAPNQTSLPDVLRLEVPSNSITYKLIKNRTKQKGQKTPLVTHAIAIAIIEVDYSPIPSLQNPKPFESNADHNLCKEGTKNNHRTNWAWVGVAPWHCHSSPLASVSFCDSDCYWTRE